MSALTDTKLYIKGYTSMFDAVICVQLSSMGYKF